MTQFTHASRHFWVFAFLMIFPFFKKIVFLLSRCYYPHRSRDAVSPVCGIVLAWNTFKYTSYRRQRISWQMRIRLYHRIFLPIRVRQTVFRIIRICRCSNYPLGTYLGFWKSQFWPPVAEIWLFKVFRNRMLLRVENKQKLLEEYFWWCGLIFFF